jgi:hypothetical protein
MTLAESWRSLPWVPDTREIHEWAADCVKLPPVMGRREFVPSASRHFIAPMQSLKCERVREVYILAPPRSGKTLIADCFVPWTIVNNPSAILWVFATEPQANLHCESRLMPILESVQQIQPLLPYDRHKKRSTEIQFSNGYPLHVFGSSIGNLQARGYRTVIVDECWQFPVNRVGHCRARMGDFQKTESNKFLAISQGGAPETEWETIWANGTQMEWHVPCESCGKLMRLSFDGRTESGERACVVWDEIRNADGAWDAHECSKTARFRCTHCGHDHQDTAATRARWNDGGQYVQTVSGPPDCIGYHFESLVDVSMSTLVSEWLKARNNARIGVYEPTIEFIQKRRAMFSNSNTVLEGNNQLARVDDANPVENEECRIMTVDVQAEDMYWVMVRSWAKGGESRRLFWGHVSGTEAIEEIRKRFDVLATPKSSRVLIDANWQREARHVYGIAARHGYIACAGAPQDKWTHTLAQSDGAVKATQYPWSKTIRADPDIGSKNAGRRWCNLIRFSSDVCSDRLQGMIDCGLWKEPKESDTEEEREYVRQLNSEVKRSKRRQDGSVEWYWHQMRQDNHARDCAKMQAFAAMKLGLV